MNQALILGAVTPIGCRLAEAVCDRGLSAVAAVGNWEQAARLARLPLPMLDCSSSDPDAITRALRDYDTVFYCAEVDSQADGTLAQAGGVGTSAWRRVRGMLEPALFARRRKSQNAQTVLSAALRGGIRRVIWITGAALPGALDTTILHDYNARGLLVTVLRPATVYGPFCSWTIHAVRALRRGRKPRAATERCLYVDHLVEAMLLAGGTDAGAGEVFALHDQDPESCELLVDAHARASSITWQPPSATHAAVRNAKHDEDLERARRVLGYSPQTGFAENMEVTGAWIRWSRL